MMNSEFNRQILQWGKRHQVTGNQTIPLDDLQTVWIVQSGEIALFRVSSRNGIASGARRYLFSCEAGDAVFGILPEVTDQSYFVAVSIVPTELLQISQEQLQTALETSDAASLSLLETWMKKCQATLDRIQPGKSVLAEAGVGDRPFLFTAAGISLDKLLQLNTQFLHYLDQAEAQEHVAEWEQFQTQEQFSRQAADAAVVALASVLNPKAEQDYGQMLSSGRASEHDDFWQLYRAAQVVAKAAGMVLQPTKLENLARLKDPLQAIVQASRIRLRRVLLTDRWWRKDCGSLLAYTRQDSRPVALIAKSPGQYELFDPEQNTWMPLNRSVRASLSPVAYMFYRPLPERAIQVFDVLQFGLKGSVHDWSVVLWTGIGVVLLSMLLPLGTAILIDQAIPDADREMLVQLGLGLLAAIIGGLVFQMAQGVALMRIETLMESSIQTAFWDRLLSLSAPFFRQYSIGDLRERVSVISAIRNQISGAILRTLFTSLFALFNLVVLFYYGGSLAWVACGIAVLMGVVTVGFGRVMLRQLIPLQELEGKLFGLMVQLIHGVAKLRVTGAEARAFAHWGNQYRRQQELKLKMQQIEDNLLVFNQLLPIVSLAVLLSIAVGMSQLQSPTGLSIGAFLAFNVAFGSFMVGVTDLSNTLFNILTVTVLWRRAKPILHATPEVDAGKTDPGQLSGRLVLDRITFRYRSDGPPILCDVTIAVEPGEFIAIVGPSGSGKSTLFRLLLGFETPQSGQVYYDGQDLRSLNIYAVRRQLGVLLQNSRTNTASIFDNIAGNALITMDEAWDAARYAGLAEEIEAMPMGMHTVVSEGGSNLSGGQRQRLMIARSIALKPRILLFDEATSSLDNRTQAIVSESLERLQITRIVIAHRLSTIQNADRIYVLQAGRIVQEGRFDDLIQQEGLFLQLMQQQIA
ncbi:MAG: NHLP bacteriocin export ABC transporter permease/ATPase subunit [Leptolyngbyaceae cyanobacterium bins.302]|nr:NHLP bacteriocin export ABC transporter permease/ATPase subunit [Leptolyngbyaceae cyanobacterium bins.302]